MFVRSVVETHDSAGIPVITISPDAVAKVPEFSIGTPIVAVGAEESTPDALIGEVADAALLADGRIVVADRMTTRLALFNAHGGLVTQLAGPGRGPGEFRRITALSATLDTIRVYDVVRNALATFVLDHGFLSETPIRSPGGAGGQLLHRVIGPVGEVVVVVVDQLPAKPDRPYDVQEFTGDTVSTFVTLRRATNPLVLDTFRTQPVVLVSLPAAALDSLRPESHGEVYIGAQLPYPLSARVQVDAVPDGILVAIPDRGMEVRQIDFDGKLRKIVRLAFSQRRAEPDSKGTYAAWAAARAAPGYEHLARRAINVFDLPASLPSFTDIRGSADGGFWVETGPPPRSIAEGVEWLQFSAAGEPVGRLRIPLSMRVLEFHVDRLVAVTRDSSDVQRVAVMPFDRSPDAANKR
jgi:hypothetical protein